MIRAVQELGLETCVTLVLLKEGQAEQLKTAGLDYYNHNLNTALEFYGQVVTTHNHQNCLDTFARVRKAGVSVCFGSIDNIGETRTGRVALIVELANLEPPPESVPIDNLVPVPDTSLENTLAIDPFEFVRTIAAARITMPASLVQLSAGGGEISAQLQALWFLTWANPIFYGEKLPPPATRMPTATSGYSSSSGCVPPNA